MGHMLGFLLIGLLSLLIAPQASAKEVTNADIQGAILTLVHSFNVMDNKLERHEHRERALGEVIKRALQVLQKGQKVYEPIKGIFSRLDERVSQIETMLIAQEEKNNEQNQKLTNTIDTMFKWMTANAACDKSGSGSSDVQTKLIEKVEKLSENVEKLSKSSQGLLEQTDKLMGSKLATADEVISKMEDKLSHFYITGPVSTPSSVGCPEFEDKITNYLDKIYDKVGDIKSCQKAESKFPPINKEFFESLHNDTQKSISDLKQECNAASDKAMAMTKDNVKEITCDLKTDIDNVAKNFADTNIIVEKIYVDVNTSIASLQNDLDVFNKFDKVLLATSDYVLDTQRKVEYGTHQVILKIGDLIKTTGSDLNNTVQYRFDGLNDVVAANHKEALQNLSAVMESELSHVWRQMEVMHGEVAYCKDVLDKLQGQTDMYVNGTIATMDTMGGKVSQITGRMSEVDENLNYLLGRLSLVTQEFNQIKTGLGSALDQIRSSFQTVQDKIKDVGPGPHPIEIEAEAK